MPRRLQSLANPVHGDTQRQHQRDLDLAQGVQELLEVLLGSNERYGVSTLPLGLARGICAKSGWLGLWTHTHRTTGILQGRPRNLPARLLHGRSLLLDRRTRQHASEALENPVV